jgi:hypothetical protein
MKAKLNKVDNGYVLLVDNIMYATDNDKLSKQNCDEIFGVVDVEKLANELYKDDLHNPFFSAAPMGFIDGFNKAIELNKDKVFTLEEVHKLLRLIHILPNFELEQFEDENNVLQIDTFISHHIQQPTEIEVEIEYMFSVEENGESTNTGITKLDENGCLILKRI